MQQTGTLNFVFYCKIAKGNNSIFLTNQDYIDLSPYDK